MEKIFFVIAYCLLSLNIPPEEIPVITMQVGEGDEVGTEEEESCFGCGDCSIYCLIENEYAISGSGFLPARGSVSYAPANVDDHNLRTAWVEGKKGPGTGEWIEFSFDRSDFSNSEAEVNGLYLFNGYRKSLTHWKDNGRIASLKMILNGQDFALLRLHDTWKIQSCRFAPVKLREIKTIRFEIMEVVPGARFADAALSELRFEGTHHH